jgi:hypothetical protein
MFICSLTAIILLAACSPVQFSEYPGTETNPASSNGKDTPSALQTTDPTQGDNGLSTEMKLLVGTIQLEGTKLEVTPDQSKELYQLWVEMKSTFANIISTTDDITAITIQIQSTMTKEQLQAINDMKLTDQDLTTLLQKLNISTGHWWDGDDDSTQTGTDVPQSATPGLNPDITPTMDVTSLSPNENPQFTGDRWSHMIPFELLDVLIKYLQARQSK